MTSCNKTACLFAIITKLANAALIVFAVYLFMNSYGADAKFALLLAVPPVLSLLAMCKCADKETRNLKKRIEKAQLRKELDDLKPYDK